MNRLRFFALAAAAALGLAGAAPAAGAAQLLRFQDYPGLGNLMIRVARSKGWCEAAGIECELKTIPAAPLGLQALIGGSIDVAQTPLEVVAAAVQRGAQLRTVSGSAVTNIFQIDAAANLALPDAAQGWLAMMKGFSGKRIGVTARGSASESLFAFLLQQAGMKADAVTYVAVGAPNTAFAALRAGQVDAAVSWEPAGVMCELSKACKMVYRAGVRGGGPALLDAMDGAGTGLVMREADIRAHPEWAQAVLKVSKQAEAFINDPVNEAEVLRISSTYFKFDMPQGDLVARRSFELGVSTHTFRTVVDRGAVAATLEYLRQTRQLTGLPTPQQLVWDQAPEK